MTTQIQIALAAIDLAKKEIQDALASGRQLTNEEIEFMTTTLAFFRELMDRDNQVRRST